MAVSKQGFKSLLLRLKYLAIMNVIHILDLELTLPLFIEYNMALYQLSKQAYRGHGGKVVTLSPPTSEAGVRSPSRPYVGKLVVACRWSAVYSTEP